MDSLFDPTGGTAMVVGATGILGGASAEGPAAAGDSVAVLERNAARGAHCVQRITSAGGQARFFTADASEPASLAAARLAVTDALGEPTILVNAAGGNDSKVTVTPERAFEQITAADRRLLFNEDGTPTARAQSILGHTPMGRFGAASELVGAAAGFVTGIDLRVDGGFLSQTI